MILEKLIDKFQSAGLWVETYHREAFGIRFVLSDRCTLDKKYPRMGVVFDNYDYQAGDMFLEARVDTWVRYYQKGMENFGGFERADVRLSS